MMSRMYNQTGNLYSGVLDCIKKTIKTEGPLAIYKGVTAHLARILPHTVSSSCEPLWDEDPCESFTSVAEDYVRRCC